MTIIYQANRWRITDDGAQWILWVRKGHERKKASGYLAMSFCLQRTSLIHVIAEKFGAVPPAAEGIIDGLPYRHPGPAQ